MARLIDADELWMINFPCAVTPYEMGWDNAIKAIVENAPTVDAVEVVRCKDCKYFNQKADNVGFCKCGEVCGGRPFARLGDSFCSFGERRGQK